MKKPELTVYCGCILIRRRWCFCKDTNKHFQLAESSLVAGVTKRATVKVRSPQILITFMTLLCLQAGILCLFHLSPSFAAVLRATASHKRGPRAEWMPSRHRNPHKTVDENNFRRYALVPTTIFTFREHTNESGLRTDLLLFIVFHMIYSTIFG